MNNVVESSIRQRGKFVIDIKVGIRRFEIEWW